MRTGATEIEDKLPAALDTTFHCYPNSVIFSDYAEDFHGHAVYDVLADIDDEIKHTHEDFSHYQHVLQVGRQGLDKSELSGKVSDESGPVGKNDNAGWRLDKWKFLPMINSTLHLYPDMDWYVFVEPDTYLVWSNLLQWLPKLDPSQPLYYGSEVMIGDDLFAHGGSAFLLSKPAMEKAAETYRTKTRDWLQYTGGHWAGDCILGKALHDVGVELSWGWPMFQGGNPNMMRWDEDKSEGRKLWCASALSYHHLTPDERRDLFTFEQNWLQAKQNRAAGVPGSDLPFSYWQHGDGSVLHHGDTFKLFVRPNMTSQRMDWNNNSADNQTSSANLDECRALCEANSTCVQYAIGPSGCATSNNVQLGRPATGFQSGWLEDRVDLWARGLDGCLGHSEWTRP
jgi:hypothetical protein